MFICQIKVRDGDRFWPCHHFGSCHSPPDFCLLLLARKWLHQRTLEHVDLSDLGSTSSTSRYLKIAMKVIFKLMIVKHVAEDLLMILRALRHWNSCYKRNFCPCRALQSLPQFPQMSNFDHLCHEEVLEGVVRMFFVKRSNSLYLTTPLVPNGLNFFYLIMHQPVEKACRMHPRGWTLRVDGCWSYFLWAD